MKLLIAILLLISPTILFADSKISDLTADTNPTLDDLTITVNDPAGTPANRKVTIANIFKPTNITVDGTNVGVNSVAPSARLDVVGTVQATTFSGSGASLTALPAAGISGVIPIANLATGTPDGTKFIRDDGTLQAVTSGSGTVSSGVASYYGRYPSTGTTIDDSAVTMDDGTNVGIGTAIPNVTLNVIGNVGFGANATNHAKLELVGNGSSEMLRVNDSASNDTTPIVFTSGGNVGIGTSTASSPLCVGPACQFSTNGYVGVFNQNISSSGDTLTLTNTSTATGKGLVSTCNALTTGWCGLFQSSATGMTGNIAQAILSGSNAANTGNVFFAASTGAASVGPVLRVDDATAETTPFIISAVGGNVGVGTFSPNAQFDLRYQASTPPFQIGSSASDSTGAFLKMDTAGNVGIGTISPGVILDINGKFRSIADDLGWSVVDQTDNQACTTGCTSACVIGIENATGTAITGLVSCAATTSDLCVCAGAN